MTAASLPSLLASLTDSVRSATSALPDSLAVAPPADGISLLDTKNELFLAYLQNLVFLILLKLRNSPVAAASNGKTSDDDDREEHSGPHDEVVRKLVELRVYLERGVKPLEGRLRYQVDKVVRAAEESATRPAQSSGVVPKAKAATGKKHGDGEGTPSSTPGEESDEDQERGEDAHVSTTAHPVSYRPNPASLMRPSVSATARGARPTEGVYRPPRITPTSLPTTERRETRTRAPPKSATMDEFVADELSTAPLALPSVGSTITAGGRRTKSAREREDERERRAYEEMNFVRLPKESRKETAKKGRGQPRDQAWGGEDWREIGRGAERVVAGTERRRKDGVLERAKKRSRETGSGGGDGGRMGDAFAKKRRTLETREKRRKG